MYSPAAYTKATRNVQLNAINTRELLRYIGLLLENILTFRRFADVWPGFRAQMVVPHSGPQ